MIRSCWCWFRTSIENVRAVDAATQLHQLHPVAVPVLSLASLAALLHVQQANSTSMLSTLSCRPSFSANSCWLLEQLQMESILQRAPRCLQIFAAKISKQGRGSKGEGEGARECKEGEEKDNDLLRGCWFITTFFGLSQLCTGI